MKKTYIILSLLFLLSPHLYIYAQNTISSDSAVSMVSSTDNTFICPDKKEAYLYVNLAAANPSKRLPLNICLVIDRSGSMSEEDRLHNAKIAVSYLIDHLNPDDICAIVMYDHVAEVLHGATPVTDKEHLKKKIHHIRPGGHTNIYMGLQLGYNEVKINYSPHKINRVILLSDGLANEGITDDYLLEMIVKDHSVRDNISLSTYGMGHEFNEKLMHNLAEYAGGNYYFVERAQDAINDFGAEIKMLLGVVAKDGILKIDFPANSLKVGHVFGMHYTAAANEIKIDLKEIHPNEQHGILVKFHFTPPITESINFTTTLSYLNVLTNQKVVKTQNSVIKNSPNVQDCTEGFNSDVVNKIAFYNSSYYIDSASDHAEKGDYESARKTLHFAKLFHKSSTQDASLKQQYQLIEEYDNELEKNKNAHPSQLKLLHKKIRHKNYKLKKGQCPVL